jgi:polyphosphate kinase
MGNKNNDTINREISWLHFNERVLQEAIDPATPLIEKIRFLGIFSNNRDEFFRVRVASLTRILTANNSLPSVKKENTAAILKQIKEIVLKQEKVFTETYIKIVKDLANEGVYLMNENELDEEQGLYIKQFYQEKLRQFLFPVMLGDFQNITSIKDGSIYLAVELCDSKQELKTNYALVKVPQRSLSRFLRLPQKANNHYIILLDDVIRYCLEDIFALFGYDTFRAYTIKITRDAELDVDNDISKSFLENMSESVKQRKSGDPVRFVYDKKIPPDFLKKVTKKLKISNKDNFRGGGRYHNFKDFMSFPTEGLEKFTYPEFPPLQHKDIKPNQSIIKVLQEKDIMLHFPYQSFQYIIDLLREASIDPKVSEIKMTFYRSAKYSNVVNALVNAARNGKKVTVFLEIQARFDEEANIILANKLHSEGVKIVPTIPGFKVHSKLILIKRQEGEVTKYYSNISTGNFNESTAKVYADESLLTANQEIAAEVDKVFDLFETRYNPPEFNTLIVSPFHTRNFFMKALDNEIKNAKEGKEAWAILKLNSLVDNKLVQKIYQASEAGVKLKLIIRGICVLVPNRQGKGKNIEVVSIVDRFLEHSRILIFCNDGDNQFYIGSADWMPRNLDHRIEVMTPILDKEIKRELYDLIQIQLKDNCKARKISKSQTNQYKRSRVKKPTRSQFEIYNYFKNKS